MSACVRPARADDIAAITAIYAGHVLTGLATFEEVPPDAAEMARRHADIAGRGLPYLVAEEAGRRRSATPMPGPTARAAPIASRVEDSIYLAPGAAGRGLGRALLTRVIAESTAWGARQMLAVIGDSGNAASIGLHRSLGFRHLAVLEAVGFKFGRWVDTVTMQLPLGEGSATLPPA